MVSTLPFCAAQTKETDIKQKSRNGATLLRTIYSLNAEIMWGRVATPSLKVTAPRTTVKGTNLLEKQRN